MEHFRRPFPSHLPHFLDSFSQGIRKRIFIIHTELLLEPIEAVADVELVGAGMVRVSKGTQGCLAMEVESSRVGLVWLAFRECAKGRKER
jgi:hypothetical protein